MGQATREATLRIYRSLLALGVFEQNGQALSRDDIIGKLECVNIKTSEEAKRLINTINIWLGDENRIEEINEARALKYKINFTGIEQDKYKDFLDVLLSLYEIGDRQFDQGIEQLYQGLGRKALGTISKLILASKDNREVFIKYEYYENKIHIKPSKLKKNENGRWIVDCKILTNTELESPLDISKIKFISDPL